MAKKDSKAGVRKVLVAGDICIDWLLHQLSEKAPRDKDTIKVNWKNARNTHMHALPGGALMLRDFIKKITGAEIVSYPAKKLENIPPNEIIHSIAEVTDFPVKTGDVAKTIRIKNLYGYSGPADEESLKIPKLFGRHSDADVIIIDDAGNGFRDDNTDWLDDFDGSKKKPIILYKMSWPLASGKLWKKVIDKHAHNLILIINANDLREEGVNISRKLSWERTIGDFMVKFPAYKDFDPFARCPNILIRFGLEGVIHCFNTPKETEGSSKGIGQIARLYYIPDQCEDENTDKTPGLMQGLTTAFVACLGANIILSNDMSCSHEDIGNAIPAAMAGPLNLLQAGYILDGNRLHYPYSEICSFNRKELIKELELSDFDVSSDYFDEWTILNDQTQMNTFLNIARKYVIHGPTDDLKNVPVVSFEKLVTADVSEIENFRSIKNLIKEYLDQKNSKKPLSLGVFGPPGSGKSFGVKQVAKAVRQEKSEPLTYNVSQFDTPQDLVKSFHEIRDHTLRGTVPLIFFDEFDTSFKGESLGWLKYFLAPMQDGEFKDGERVHPIGKAIFVFAGGTSKSFMEFSREDYCNQDQDVSKEFVEAKGPDFVSRLQGYVDILGPNPNDLSDKFYIIRRAVLLRSILTGKKNIIEKGGKVHIDEDVLNAFLLIPEYKHGSRSMSSIVDMSMLSSRNIFEKAALPSPKQLDLHVNSDIFMKLLDRNVFFKTVGEKMARAAHENYRKEQLKKPDPKPANHPSMRDWDKLDEDRQDSNRQLAYDIPIKLLRIKCDYRKPDSKRCVKINFDGFTGNEIEILAEMEHQRWVQDKFSKGWKYGHSNDDEKTHVCLLPWNKLSDEVKGYDRDAVKAIPEILKIAEYEIYRF
jgi:hypothetical protein